MDKQNETILKILKQDSRFTAAQIAAASGMTEAEVQGRITAMENEGVISGPVKFLMDFLRVHTRLASSLRQPKGCGWPNGGK